HKAEEGSHRAARLLDYMRQPQLMLTALLVGTNLAMVVSTITVASLVDRLRMSPVVADLLSTLIVAPVVLVFAETMPKSVFRIHPNRLTLALLPLVRPFYILFVPITYPISAVGRLLIRVKGGEASAIPFVSSLEEVRVLVDEGVDGGTIEPEEQEMIHGVIDLQTTPAKEIMVPRIHIQAIPDTATRTELAALFEKSGLTRIPVYHETIDRIIGIINAYDLILDDQPEEQNITRLMRDAIHVPDTLKVDDLFKMLKDAKQHVAIVTDEYGGTDGLVTLEDILEEIFGEIQDEYDREEKHIHRIGPHAYVIDALTPVDEVAETLDERMPEYEVETIGGWLTHVAGRIPTQGEVVTEGRFRMTVLDGSPRHVARLRLEVLPPHTDRRWEDQDKPEGS
ncbi:MAG TPA: HlyC/CorC family transporter, partial [Candidatus Hydrogenedentes bacterium]|nr:HlyC/CorC family transporter [Candidatus Hydrogenedentota bacterium]